jgi:hypothetical protein
MSPRISALLAGSAWALCAAFVLLSVPLYWSTSTSVVLLGVPQIVAVLALAALVLAFSSVGALIVARRPGNGVGWILCAAGLTIGATTLASGYAVFSLTGPSGLPATEWAAWFAYWIWVPGVGPAMTFGLLMFPDGRLPSRRWRGGTPPGGGGWWVLKHPPPHASLWLRPDTTSNDEQPD